MKPKESMYQAATQVKVLRPVIFNVVEVEAFHCDRRQHQEDRYGKIPLALPGSEAVA